eukprot:CAMPEP_0185572496 /NCGR_PEP_ID=MMETSP0434-20130131/4411_1 /TAXON_ID=626734 ORGANISM="Favella taraikaensis, Strain Fe Narragansett Bay" /NCGR_SAMPLE_ID=MMETSP0434 /ASSEMBLY_ACC=CAM_ASM_000379 /LENGTH=55 /DNA_ID=CAMNT_0028188385 /DNA_START=161 /DNA_END=328 /DNA_ORIENTATION=-
MAQPAESVADKDEKCDDHDNLVDLELDYGLAVLSLDIELHQRDEVVPGSARELLR